MADTALAGLPRLVRVTEEVRMRGIAALGVGVAAGGWWALGWLLGLDLSPLRTVLGFVGVGVPALLVAGLASGRRLRAAADPLPPPRIVVYETIADGRERRTRLAGIIVFGVIILMMFDRLYGGGGEMAGLVAGLFCAVGVVDLMEARAWTRIERRAGGGDLYLLVRPHALMASMAPSEVYERPRRDREAERREPTPFDL